RLPVSWPPPTPTPSPTARRTQPSSASPASTKPVWPRGMYSHVAGFVEAGESLEGCVRREVGEEVGVAVDHVRYLGSQPWPFPRSLMVGFHATADPEAPIVLEDEEIAEARWFDVDEVRAALAGEGDLMVAPPVS